MVMVRTGGVDWLRMLYCAVWKDSPSELLLFFYSNIRRGKRVVEIVAPGADVVSYNNANQQRKALLNYSNLDSLTGISKRNNASMLEN